MCAERSAIAVAPTGFRPVTRAALKNVGNRIGELPGVEKVILFGSYARGNPTPDSDVDIIRRPKQVGDSLAVV